MDARAKRHRTAPFPVPVTAVVVDDHDEGRQLQPGGRSQGGEVVECREVTRQEVGGAEVGRGDPESG